MKIKFEVGNVYQLRFIGDIELRPEFICTHRSPKMATFKSNTGSEVIKRKIKIWDNEEIIDYASYSMSPTIRASKVIS